MRTTPGVLGRVATFIALTWMISGIFYFLIIYSGHIIGGRKLFVLGLMWSPGVAALVTLAIHSRPVASLGWSWGKTRLQLISYGTPLAYAAVAYVIAWGTGLAGFGNPDSLRAIAADFGWASWPPALVVVCYVLLQATVGLVLAVAYGLGEEIGWRGFLVPELSRRFSFTKLSIISGVVWASWHYPTLLFADYNSGTPAWYGLTCFTIMVIGISFVFAWMRLRSGSLWTGAILHGSHNLFVQDIFDLFTSDVGPTEYVSGEFGVLLAATAMGAATVVWLLRRKVEKVQDGLQQS